MFTNKKLAILGGGKMGGILVKGVIDRKILAPENITVTDIDAGRLEELASTLNVRVSSDNKKAVKQADVIILAVKPQTFPKMLQEIRPAVTASKIFLSIAAGIPTEAIEKALPKGARVLRAMPNVNALAGEWAAAVACGKNASGPAYCFVIIEALADAGVQLGLPRNLAENLAVQTMLGSARLCQSSKQHPAQLKNMVTSPGGTTAAGLKVLEEGKIRATLIGAVEAAVRRAKELGESK